MSETEMVYFHRLKCFPIQRCPWTKKMTWNTVASWTRWRTETLNFALGGDEDGAVGDWSAWFGTKLENEFRLRSAFLDRKTNELLKCLAKKKEAWLWLMSEWYSKYSFQGQGKGRPDDGSQWCLRRLKTFVCTTSDSAINSKRRIDFRICGEVSQITLVSKSVMSLLTQVLPSD